MSWHTGRLAAFDIETTGVNPESDRIVTAAVSIVGGGLPADHHSWFVNPGIDIPLGATSVHGITTEQARAAGSNPEEGIDEIKALLTAQLLNGVPVVAFNARFDLTILDREARRHGLQPLLDRVGGPDGILVVDPHVLDKHFDRYRPGKRTLGAVCRQYSVSLERAHTANADALAAARLAYRMGATVPEQPDPAAHTPPPPTPRASRSEPTAASARGPHGQSAESRPTSISLESFSRDEQILGGIGLLLAIDLLFLPWFQISVGSFSFSTTATQDPDGWLGVLALLVALTVIVDLAIERFSPHIHIPSLTQGHAATRFLLALVAGGLVALKFLFHIHFSLFGVGFWLAAALSVALVVFAWRLCRIPVTVGDPPPPSADPGASGGPPGRL